MNQTVFITNRKLKENGSFTNVIGESIQIGIVNSRDKLTLSTIEELEAYAANSNTNPWLFLVHGNNKSVADNIKTINKLKDAYNVNICIFSWPSKSYAFSLKKAVKKALPYFLIPLLAVRVLAIPGSMFHQKKKQYHAAKRMARETALANRLGSALEIFSQHLLPNVPGNPKKILFVHSLGHYLLRHQQEALRNMEVRLFDRAIFHAADCDADDHGFLTQLGIVRPEDSYVFQNKKDGALWSSSIINGEKRLGAAPPRRDFDTLNYVDFSHQVDNSHTYGWKYSVAKARVKEIIDGIG